MKTLRRAIIAILLIVLVCATFVACNDGNNPPANENGQQTLGKKPIANPDPNNPYDVRNSERDYSEEKYQYDCQKITVTLTNSESLNNLFYDYVLADFGENIFGTIEEKTKEKTEKLRQQTNNGVQYDENGSTLVNPKTFWRIFALTLKDPTRENVVNYINTLMKRKDVLYADPELKGGSWFKTSNDAMIGQQWSLGKIDAYGAWELTTGSSSVTVGLIDSGIRKTHEDLSANIADGGYAATNQSPHSDSVDHGTRTAGIIGAVGNNGKGISGVCWNVNIVSLKACIGSQDETPELVINAIEYAKTNNIKLLNFSGGFYDWEITETEIQGLKTAISNYSGLIVVAAGNGKNEYNQSIPGTDNDVKRYIRNLLI